MAIPKSSVNRVLAVLSMSRLTERDVLDFMDFARDVGPSRLFRIIRSFEKEILSEARYLQGDFFEHDFGEDPALAQLYDMVEEFRTRELRVPVRVAADLIEGVLHEIYPARNLDSFQPKLGMRNWIARLMQTFTPSEIYQAVATIRERGGREFQRSWSINRR